MFLRIVERTHDQRAVVEQFVQGQFLRAYGATPDDFPSLIYAAFASDGRVMAAAGLRTSEDGFFSDAYLDKPLETMAAGVLGCPVDRSMVLEVSNLASIDTHAVFPLMSAVLTYGRTNGFSCGLFTMTASLRRVFRRLDIEFLPLVPAVSSRIKHPEKWGSYYKADPWVCLMPNPGGSIDVLFSRCKEGATPSPQETPLYG